MRYVHSIVSLTIAATATTSAVELPARCKLPAFTGPCRSAMPRWHFNTASNSCEKFIFGGCMPNKNNFFTESQCENACEAFVPHQLKSGLSGDNTGLIKQKSAPIVDDGCSDEPKVVGRCRGALKRWSWNQETLECESFAYGGCGENGNNYPSKKKCEKKCGYLASQRVMVLDAVENEDSEEQEPKPVDPCTEPKEVGPCRAMWNKFFYNSVTGDCEEFNYGGCGGNGNNFQSKHACRIKCLKTTGMQHDSGVSEEEEEEEKEITTKKPRTVTKKPKTESPEKEPEADLCTLPKDTGMCRGYFPSWFFNGEKCEKFVYGGCQGNKNRFDSEEECQKVCQNDEPIFGRFLVNSFGKDNGDEKPVCEQPIFSGPCRAISPKWGFDGENCVQFNYGGCMGNQNKFGDENQCRQSCMMANDEVRAEEEEEEEDEEDEEKNGNGNSLIMSREAICEFTGPGKIEKTKYQAKLTCDGLPKVPKTTNIKVDYLNLSNMDTTTGKPTGQDLADYLEKFTNLKIIVLDGNKFLNSIPSDTFVGMKKLKVVSMIDSGIRVLPKGLFSMNPQLKCLILKDSAVSSISKNVFRGNVANKLKEVNLKGSGMTKKSGLNGYFKGKKNIAKFLSRLP